MTNEDSKVSMNLAGKQLTRVPLLADEQRYRRCDQLVLDHNAINQLNGIERYEELQTLSVSFNRLVTLNRLHALTHLRVLNVEHNSIVDVEGLSCLHQLEWLSLAGNNLKDFAALKANVKLSHLDLSDNSISSLGEISGLRGLKALLLHGNILTSLRNVPTHLPASLAVLTLADNEIHDLIQVSFLSCLPSLTHFSLSSNPCVLMTAQNIGFDYRPFVLYFCTKLSTIDGFSVSPSERDRSLQLFPDGHGCPFAIGQHQQLTQYLGLHCPLTTAENLHAVLESENLARRLLFQTRQHQPSVSPRSTLTSSPLRLPHAMSSKSSPLSHKQLTNASLLSTSLASHHSPLVTASLSTTVQSMDVESLQSQHEALELCLSEYHEQQRQHMAQLFNQQRELLKQGVPLETVINSLSPNLLVPGLETSQQLQQASPQSEFGAHSNRLDGSLQSYTRISNESPPQLDDSLIVEDIDDQTDDLLNSTTHYLPLPPDQSVFSPQKLDETQENIYETQPDTQTDSARELIHAKKAWAATVIQAWVRGHQLRSRLAPYVEQTRAAVVIQSAWRGYCVRTYHPRVQAMKKELRYSRMESCIISLQQELDRAREQLMHQGEVRRLHEKAVGCLWEEVRVLLQWKESCVQREMEKAAIRIQAAWRGYQTRKDIKFHNTASILSLTKLCKTLQNQIDHLQKAINNLSAQVYVPGETTARFHRLGFTGGHGSDQLTSSTSNFGGSDNEEMTGNNEDLTRPTATLPDLELHSQEDTIGSISGIPTAPLGLTVSHREDDLVTVQWLPASPRQLSNKMELPVLGYHVYIDRQKVEMVSAGSSQATVRVSPTQKHELFVRAVSAMGESLDSSLLTVPVDPLPDNPKHLCLAESDSEQPGTRQTPRTVEEPCPETTELKQSPRDRAVNLLSSLQQEILGGSSPQLLVSPTTQPGLHSPLFIPDTDNEAKENRPPDHDPSALANDEAAMPTQQNGHDFDLCLLKDQDQSHDQSESSGTESPTSILSLYSLPSTLPNLDFSPSIMMAQFGNNDNNSTTN